jgi:ABC-type sugar transport system ATPase subunit
MTNQPPILIVNKVTKTFPGVVALDEVSFDIRPGEVHALVGENGAGKSTLMKVLAGLYKSDGGEIIYQGKPVDITSPLDARHQGILLIHQELSLSSELSVAENIFLGAWPTNRFGILRKSRLNKDAQAALTALGADFGPSVRLGSLSIAKQQMVEIARANAFEANIVIFDEPTASLTDTEKDLLFKTIRDLRDRGVGIVYISHKMNEIFDLTDRITVLRDGQVQGTVQTNETSIGQITQMMIGRELETFFHRAKSVLGTEVLRVDRLTNMRYFRDVSFSVRQGEVLGLYGLVGAGRSELVETIFGVRMMDAGKIFWQGQPTGRLTPRKATDLGMALVPESRKEQGLVLGQGGRANISLPHPSLFSRATIMNVNEEMRIFEIYKKRLEIKTTGPEQVLSDLSGGNQQKFVLAKWLCADPKLIILDEPTRGIDIGLKSAIHELIAGLAENGLAVIVISSEMPEVLGVSHRILTMSEGHLVGEFSGDEMTEKNLIEAVSHRAQEELLPV